MSRNQNLTFAALVAASFGLTATACGPSQEQLDRVAELAGRGEAFWAVDARDRRSLRRASV